MPKKMEFDSFSPTQKVMTALAYAEKRASLGGSPYDGTDDRCLKEILGKMGAVMSSDQIRSVMEEGKRNEVFEESTIHIGDTVKTVYSNSRKYHETGEERLRLTGLLQEKLRAL